MTAQVHKVDPHKTITFEVPGATAAYSLDSFLAEATAENGVVTVVGNQPGATHIVVITPSGVQTFDVLVNTLPPVYPVGFVMPVAGAATGESGYAEGRFYSSPSEIQDQFDFLKIYGDNRTRVHIVETNLLGPLDPGQSRVALSSATYQIVTPRRDITLFDKYVDESQLTINGSIIRGFHMAQDNWFVHAGYTSVTTFDGLFLPTQPELVIGGGYRRPLTANSSITGSFYQIRIPTADPMGRSGSVGDVRYKYKSQENFWFTIGLGIGRGIAGAGQLHYKTARDTILGLARYMPQPFASLGANNMRGLHTDFSWNRHVTKKFESTLTFYNNNLVLPGIRETTISGALNFHYDLTKHWAVTGGALASSFQTKEPLSPAIRNLTLPAGLAFQSKHFGATGQYQFEMTPELDHGGSQYRASARSGWGGFIFTGYAERDTNAPTLSFILGQVTGLQQALDLQGIRATTVQQVDELLSSDAFLIAAGYIKGATINLVPVRTQLGATAGWTKGGAHKMQLSYSFLFNSNQLLTATTISVGHTAALTRSVTRGDDLSLACSVVGVTTPGVAREFSPVCYVAWKHQLQHVPYFVVPERRGTIAGNVFRDDESTGEFETGMRPMAEVEILLDNRRKALTGADGAYRFQNVPRGKHKLEVKYESNNPFFVTTASEVLVAETATVNFGIGFALSGLTGQVLNDAGVGVDDVTVAILSRGMRWSASTQADGKFFVGSLVAGDYNVQVDEDSLPAGYSTESLDEPHHVTVGASAPGNAAFTARALRSISGRVLRYDPQAERYVPVTQAQVLLREHGLTLVTDAAGRYLFHDLAAGSYTLSLQNQTQESTRTVRLGNQPVDLSNIDFQISPPPVPPVSPPAPPEVPPVIAIEAVPTSPVTIAPPLVSVIEPAPVRVVTKIRGPIPPVVPAATAQQHNLLGRELTKAGRYREAIVELTEAIRLAPDFALALNARGFARMMLHDWAGAIADLDEAILLNPNYENAYQIRAAAKRASGDAAGAAADLTKAVELSKPQPGAR